mmetsp:Transcript_28704/g.84913  ORF Transcript_28704/g.84913 Transcript_28704/m.84913 type:complete len:205 (-) Transcript_28704:1591-2205(-)
MQLLAGLRGGGCYEAAAPLLCVASRPKSGSGCAAFFTYRLARPSTPSCKPKHFVPGVCALASAVLAAGMQQQHLAAQDALDMRADEGWMHRRFTFIPSIQVYHNAADGVCLTGWADTYYAWYHCMGRVSRYTIVTRQLGDVSRKQQFPTSFPQLTTWDAAQQQMHLQCNLQDEQPVAKTLSGGRRCIAWKHTAEVYPCFLYAAS